MNQNNITEDGYMKGIIFEVIWGNTISNNPNTYNNLNISKYKIPDNRMIRNTSLRAFKKYLNLKKNNGAVFKFNYINWAIFINDKILESKMCGYNKVTIPNGCCTNKDCDLKLFYKLFIKENEENIYEIINGISNGIKILKID
jgi:hypothetical protein